MPADINFKDYLDSKFSDLEKLIAAKFQPIESSMANQHFTLSDHERRISSLEKRAAYILGTFLILGFLGCWLWNNKML